MGRKKCIYSIRKLSLGVASVVVACGLGFLAGSVGSVSADETLAASHILETDKPSSESIDKDKSVEGSEKEATASEEQHFEEKHLDTPKVTEKESRVEFNYIDESTGKKLFQMSVLVRWERIFTTIRERKLVSSKGMAMYWLKMVI